MGPRWVTPAADPALRTSGPRWVTPAVEPALRALGPRWVTPAADPALRTLGPRWVRPAADPALRTLGHVGRVSRRRNPPFAGVLFLPRERRPHDVARVGRRHIAHEAL